MFYKFLNVHPKKLIVDDCVKRAITLVADMDYMEVQRQLNNYKKVTGAKYFNSDYNPHKYCENVLKMKKLSFPAEPGKPRMNGILFCSTHPKGRYILNMAHHWTACIDGIIYDTWDCSDKCVYTAYEMRSDEEIKVIKDQESKELLDKSILKEKEKSIRDKYNKQIDSLRYEMDKIKSKIEKLQKQKAKDLEELRLSNKEK